MNCMKGNTAEYLLKLNEEFTKGLDCYKKQEWDEAIAHFEISVELEHERFPDQKGVKPNPSQIYIDRSNAFKENPPGADWDGVFTLTSK